MTKDIPLEVRNKILSAEFSWLTNVGPEVYTQMESVRVGGVSLKRPVVASHELGRPKATEQCSEAELIKMGMAGLYRRSGPGG